MGAGSSSNRLFLSIKISSFAYIIKEPFPPFSFSNPSILECLILLFHLDFRLSTAQWSRITEEEIPSLLRLFPFLGKVQFDIQSPLHFLVIRSPTRLIY